MKKKQNESLKTIKELSVIGGLLLLTIASFGFSIYLFLGLFEPSKEEIARHQAEMVKIEATNICNSLALFSHEQFALFSNLDLENSPVGMRQWQKVCEGLVLSKGLK